MLESCYYPLHFAVVVFAVVVVTIPSNFNFYAVSPNVAPRFRALDMSKTGSDVRTSGRVRNSENQNPELVTEDADLSDLKLYTTNPTPVDEWLVDDVFEIALTEGFDMNQFKALRGCGIWINGPCADPVPKYG